MPVHGNTGYSIACIGASLLGCIDSFKFRSAATLSFPLMGMCRISRVHWAETHANPVERYSRVALSAKENPVRARPTGTSKLGASNVHGVQGKPCDQGLQGTAPNPLRARLAEKGPLRCEQPEGGHIFVRAGLARMPIPCEQGLRVALFSLASRADSQFIVQKCDCMLDPTLLSTPESMWTKCGG